MQPVRRPMTCLWLLLAMFAMSAAALASPEAPAIADVSCQELLVNGGFEAGAAGWTQTSAGGYDLVSQFNPRTGQWGAYLAGANDADDRLSQSLLLPSSAISITLRLWWSLESEEPPVPADVLTASLLRTDGTQLAELWTWNNTSASGIWDEFVADLTPWAGQPVVLQFRARTNRFNLTDFYLDDIGVLACAAPPTPTASPTATASPTSTVSPTSTPSPTPTASPTATASPTPTTSLRRVWLPLIVRQR